MTTATITSFGKEDKVKDTTKAYAQTAQAPPVAPMTTSTATNPKEQTLGPTTFTTDNPTVPPVAQ